MTRRALVLGLLLGLTVAGTTYFNDQVIRQTYLIANHLPASVFGLALLMLLAVNPLLRLTRLGAPLGAGELAVVVALGLAVCGWPGSNLLRYFAGVVVKPTVMRPLEPSWQSTRVMSYLPGGSPLVAEGYVRNWPALSAALRQGAEGEGPLTELVGRLSPEKLQRLRHGAANEDRGLLLRLLNAALTRGAASHEQVAERRATLERALPGVILSPPEGKGLLLNDGRPHRAAIDAVIAGRPPGDPLAPWELPWSVWWPTLRLWLGLALLLGLASLCMVVVVHPQWSRRELLPYPTVEFLREATAGAGGAAGGLPAIARSRLFWAALVVVLAIHLLNGLHAWFPAAPTVPLQLPFSPLRELFPNAARVYGSHGLFEPIVYFAVIGFGFFIPTAASLSLGLSLAFWLVLGAWLLASGEMLSTGHFNAAANGGAMRFGAYIGLTLMIAYVGRRYYASVARAAVGLGGSERGSAAAWAARGMVACCAAAVALLVVQGGLDATMSAALVLLLMMIFLVLTRINVETGLFYAQPDWLPGVVLAGLFGARGLGVEAMIVLTLASVILVADPREAVAPYLANGLRMTRSIGGVPTGRAAGLLGGMLVIGLVTATVVTLWLQYNHGLNPDDTWSNRMLPHDSFQLAVRSIGVLDARGELADAARVTGLDHFANANPEPGVVAWTAVGVGLVLLVAAARLRLPWWPIHPVLFVVWGTYPANHFAFSFLLAALAKAATIRIGGARAVAIVKPAAVGMIAGELLAVVAWSAVGTVYYFVTNETPLSYRIYP